MSTRRKADEHWRELRRRSLVVDYSIPEDKRDVPPCTPYRLRAELPKRIGMSYQKIWIRVKYGDAGELPPIHEHPENPNFKYAIESEIVEWEKRHDHAG